MVPTAKAIVCESNASEIEASNHLSRFCPGFGCNECQFGAAARKHRDKSRDKSQGRSANLNEKNQGDRNFEFTTNWGDLIPP
jgi:hypothetical protein